MKQLKRLLVVSVFASLLVFPGHSFAQEENLPDEQIEKILSVYNEKVSKDSVLKEVENFAAFEGISLNEAADIIYNELKEQQKLFQKEESRFSVSGNEVIASSSKGNIFYETAKTAGISHGHVGMYYSSNTLVESVKGDGVKTTPRTSKVVGPGAQIMNVSGISTTTKEDAANWAYSRVGKDNYSLNFATNRATSCYGSKNCSKLVWCAYKEIANLDLDVNKGAGVYPKDIRDHSRTVTIKSY